MIESYKISEVAKIFGISRRTLIYYDEIDLFKPSYINEENNYRYYSGSQIYILRFILALKNSGFSLNEIKKYTNYTDINESQNFLKEKIILMEENIKKLKESIGIAKVRYDELEKMKSTFGLEPEIKEKINFYMVLQEVKYPYKDMEVQEAYNKLGKYNLDSDLHLAIVKKENLKLMNIDSLKEVGLIVKNNKETIERLKKYNKEIIKINLEKCVTITHKDLFENLKESYEKLIDYIKQNNYEIIGDSIEISNKEKIQLEKGVGEVIDIYIPVKRFEKR